MLRRTNIVLELDISARLKVALLVAGGGVGTNHVLVADTQVRSCASHDLAVVHQRELSSSGVNGEVAVDVEAPSDQRRRAAAIVVDEALATREDCERSGAVSDTLYIVKRLRERRIL